MAFCIRTEKIAEFKKALKNKDLDVFELIRMTTKARTELFRKFAGEEAKKMNTLFEEKIVLKNRDRKSTRLNSSHTDISRMPSSA